MIFLYPSNTKLFLNIQPKLTSDFALPSLFEFALWRGPCSWASSFGRWRQWTGSGRGQAAPAERTESPRARVVCPAPRGLSWQYSSSTKSVVGPHSLAPAAVSCPTLQRAPLVCINLFTAAMSLRCYIFLCNVQTIQCAKPRNNIKRGQALSSNV